MTNDTTAKQKENRREPLGLTEEGLSRRNFLKGMAIGAAGIAVSGAIPGYTVFADVETPLVNGVSRAEFIGKISNYFAWPHPTQYNDIWKAPLKQFKDVKTADRYGKQIETAYEESVTSGIGNGYFDPNAQLARQDAAVMLVKAFHLPLSSQTGIFKDEASISTYARASVNTLAALGYLTASTDGLFQPKRALTTDEMEVIFSRITAATVAPVQALPKANAVAPRRYVKLYCPTPGATIHYTTDGSEPTADSEVYTVETKGHIMEMIGTRGGGPDEPVPTDRVVTYKAIAFKDGMAASPVQTFTWNLHRPLIDDFQVLQTEKKTSVSPAVYRICNDSESVRPLAWYIEGPNSGVLFDALQTPADKKNLKTFVDGFATKPYVLIIGHEHGDHDAQAMNFMNAGVDVYLNERGWAMTSSTSGPFKPIFSTPESQAKVKNVEEGMKFDLGGSVVFEVVALPGHANGNIGIHDRKNGLLFASDFYGCTRAGSADNVGVSGIPADLLLSFVQQVYTKYTKDGGKSEKLFTGHDESPLNDNNLKLYEAALQQVVDKGEGGCRPSVRGGTDAPGARTTMIGDMWKDGTNWCAIKLTGIMGDNVEFLTSTTDLKLRPYMADAANKDVNYNFGGHVKYSVLSNIEFVGGQLAGKTVEYAAPGAAFAWAGKEIEVKNALENRFNPWAYDYTVNVPKANNSITVIPTSMSTKAASITIDGKAAAYRSSSKIAVSDGQVITVKVVAPDQTTTSTYTFKIAMV